MQNKKKIIKKIPLTSLNKACNRSASGNTVPYSYTILQQELLSTLAHLQTPQFTKV